MFDVLEFNKDYWVWSMMNVNENVKHGNGEKKNWVENSPNIICFVLQIGPKMFGMNMSFGLNFITNQSHYGPSNTSLGVVWRSKLFVLGYKIENWVVMFVFKVLSSIE